MRKIFPVDLGEILRGVHKILLYTVLPDENEQKCIIVVPKWSVYWGSTVILLGGKGVSKGRTTEVGALNNQPHNPYKFYGVYTNEYM